MNAASRIVVALVVTLAAGVVIHAAGCDNLDQFLQNLDVGGPLIVDFSPKSGYQGSLITIQGVGFSEDRTENVVRIGGVPAVVLSASPVEIEALVGAGTMGGVIQVEVNGAVGQSVQEFELKPWPSPGSGEDGPPVIYEGSGGGEVVDALPSTGTINVLVVPAYPTNKVPGDPDAARQYIVAIWDWVTQFYDQASYGRLTVNVTVTDWAPLTGEMAEYVTLDGETWAPNITPASLDRLRAECADYAVNVAGLDINDYDAFAQHIYVQGQFLRAWGGAKQSSFSYADPDTGVNINIVADHDLWLMALGESANWGRCAHELGHCMVDSPHDEVVLGEDVYTSDLVDPESATASSFDMMGSHDSHPLFSGYFLEQLGWYEPENIAGGGDQPIQWTRNPFSEQYTLVAHGLTEDEDPDRYHLVKIRVTEGLYYYVEVRQRPPFGSMQAFDTQIPVDGAPNDGGVIVTQVLVDEMHNNQQMRFITLLHEPRVLTEGESAVDPARALEITVLEEDVDPDGRLVCTVQVEWARDMEPDPNGDFDLRIEPWGPGYETVDIWIDRQPYNSYDFTDDDGNPVGNGDRPRPLESNRFWARVHSDGSADASDVQVTYYAITPPGVGDNGNWTPLPNGQVVHAAVSAGGSASEWVEWVPAVGEHTCLQVVITNQLGEVSYGNNRAQENVFEFEAPASSPPEPVRIPLAVRNPKNEPSFVEVRLAGVPQGYVVQLPHRWVYLEALGEKEMEAIAVPLWDVDDSRYQRYPLDLRIEGWIPRSYEEEVDGVLPASKLMPIGGFVAQVRPKHRVTLTIAEDRTLGSSHVIGIKGTMDPPFANQPVFVSLTAVEGEWVKRTTTDANGAFAASFDILEGPEWDTDEPSEGPPGVDPSLAGEYKFKAFTLAAPEVASTESNEVVIVVED